MYNLKITDHQTTLVDQVEDKLFDYFKAMNLKPGDSIPKEQELAEELGVGRSVLREALSRLRMLGLIESRTRRGMILTEPSILGGMKRVIDPRILGDEALFDLLGFRIALEVGICDLLFNNLTDEHLQELEEIVNRGVVFNYGEYTPVSEFEFHTKLYEITGNKTITEFQEVIRPVSVFLKEKFKDYFLPINMELENSGKRVTHKDLLDLLKKKDKEGFRQAMINHFTPYYSFLKKCVPPQSPTQDS
ncbi:MAG: GntR family transcriptional regulator [Bacteroidota bacterium]|nr:GntR family transcriptional regulator [Bacteroidota bacterium]MDP4225985.1 GntR family transcriptional regulator [Bacteroidota bacterium]MDP4275085.1 GntR family transcriptional regulator [Bacteroidota bacterium]